MKVVSLNSSFAVENSECVKALIEIVLMIRQFLIGPYSIKLTTVSYGFTRVPRHEKSIGNGATAEERLHHHITMALCDTIIVFETFILLLALLYIMCIYCLL